jgi:flagellar protein FliS
MNSIARAAAYDELANKSIVMGASSHGLVALLFQEFDSSLQAAEFYADQDDVASMREKIGKASKILGGLQGSIDVDKGGEIAANLAELYRFCIRELLNANTNADKKIITSVRNLIAPIKQAWNDMPEGYKAK